MLVVAEICSQKRRRLGNPPPVGMFMFSPFASPVQVFAGCGLSAYQASRAPCERFGHGGKYILATALPLGLREYILEVERAMAEGTHVLKSTWTPRDAQVSSVTARNLAKKRAHPGQAEAVRAILCQTFAVSHLGCS